jgi:hypothetical protein
LWRSGRARPPRAIRDFWAQHGATETYLTFNQARALADRLLPGAQVYHHWLWRYTIAWNHPTKA